MRTKRPKVCRVSRGLLYAEGATKAEAKAKLESMIDWALNTPQPVIEQLNGRLIVIVAEPCGYSVNVFDPAELQHGQRRDSWWTSGQGEYTDALASARLHAAQMAWSHSVSDDAVFVEASGLAERAGELRSWITFQRSYAEAKANGATDADAHAIACGYKRAA